VLTFLADKPFDILIEGHFLPHTVFHKDPSCHRSTARVTRLMTPLHPVASWVRRCFSMAARQRQPGQTDRERGKGSQVSLTEAETEAVTSEHVEERKKVGG
jgi:hypothetical protein